MSNDSSTCSWDLTLNVLLHCRTHRYEQHSCKTLSTLPSFHLLPLRELISMKSVLMSNFFTFCKHFPEIFFFPFSLFFFVVRECLQIMFRLSKFSVHGKCSLFLSFFFHFILFISFSTYLPWKFRFISVNDQSPQKGSLK